MKIKISILSITLLALTLTQSCSAQKNAAKSDSVSTAANPDSVKLRSNPIADVYNAYIEIKNSLTKDNADSAAAYAKILFTECDKVPMNQLTTSQHTVWMKLQTKISYDAEHIKGTVELEHQREHFISLSKNMFELLKAFNTNTAELYYQFCPMANDGKGAYWVSEQSKIANPYFGKQMPTCGSTKETINVTK